MVLHTSLCPYNCSFRNSTHKRLIVLVGNAKSTSSSFLPCTKNGKSFSHFDQEKPEQTDRLSSIPQGSWSKRQGQESCSGGFYAGSLPPPLSPRHRQLETAALTLLTVSAWQGKWAWRKYYAGKKSWHLPVRTLLTVEVGCLETPVTPQPYLSTFSLLFSPGMREAQQKQRFLIALFLKQTSLISAEWAETLINLEQGGRNV